MSDAKEVIKQHTKIEGVTFAQSIRFAGQTGTVAIGRNCDTIQAARMEADGQPIAIDKGQRADGLLIRAKTKDRVKGGTFVAQCFVPWANVLEILYGE